MKKKEKEYPTYKIVVMGARGVGKTAMVNQFVNNNFDELQEETNDDYERPYMKMINLNREDQENPQYCLLKIIDLFGIDDPELADSSGESKQNFLRLVVKNQKPAKQSKEKNRYYKDKEIYGFMFVYDVTNEESLDKITEFIEFICESEKKQDNGVITKKFLVGNKSDVDNYTINPLPIKKKLEDKAKQMEKRFKLKSFTCSALETVNVIQVFEELAREIYTDTEFESYEAEQKNLEKQDDEVEMGDDVGQNSKKKSKKSEGGGGLFSCTGPRDEYDDEEEEDEKKIEDANEQKIDTSKLPSVNDGSNGNCSIF